MVSAFFHTRTDAGRSARLLKLTLKIGDIARLTLCSPVAIGHVDITVDRTRETGVRLLVRDEASNGVDAWLEIGDNIHLEGYFGKPARIELDARSRSQVKLVFAVPDAVRVTRIKLADQVVPAEESEAA